MLARSIILGCAARYVDEVVGGFLGYSTITKNIKAIGSTSHVRISTQNSPRIIVIAFHPQLVGEFQQWMVKVDIESS